MTNDSEWAAGIRRTLALLVALVSAWLAFVLWHASHSVCGLMTPPGQPQPSDLDRLGYLIGPQTMWLPVAMVVWGSWIALKARRVRWRVVGIILTLGFAGLVVLFGGPNAACKVGTFVGAG